MPDSPPERSRTLRLMVEYAATTPMWVGNGSANIIDLAPLHLPPPLEEALYAWQRHFMAHFAVGRWPHWESIDAADWHVAEGHRLLDRLERALPSREITLDLWAADPDHG